MDARAVIADVRLRDDRPDGDSMKIRIVATLIIANQNSASPKALTLIMLRTKTSASAMRAMTHWGMFSNMFQ